MKKNIILIGLGEVGRAIRQIEKEAGNRVYVNDKKHGVEKICTSQTVDVMHICIPYSGDFINDTINFIKGYKPKLTIIHSTVNVGTTEEIFIRINYNFDKFITHIVHSPIRGVHPNLYKGIKEFVKYVGGYEECTDLAITHLESIGIEPYYLGSSKNTELAKILSTTYYGWNILFAKEAQRICNVYGLDYAKVYTQPNKTYNDGYTRLGMEYVVRPILYPPTGKISGHCVSQNVELLSDCPLKKVYKELNENE